MALRIFKCARCSHEWASRMRILKPAMCPSCRSLRWELPKKFDRYKGLPAVQAEKR